MLEPSARVFSTAMSTQSSESSVDVQTEGEPEYAAEAADPDYPRTDTDPTFDGTTDPLPNRGIADTTFGDLDDDHTNPDTVFDRTIVHNAYTCGNCFARLGRQWELPNTQEVEDLAGLVSYIHCEIPYQIPKDNRDKLDNRFYQAETFGSRAGFIPAAGKHHTTKRILICYECGHQLTQSSGPSTYGIYRGSTMPDGVSYTPARAWRYDADEDDSSTRTRDAPRSKKEAIRAAHTLSDTLTEYGIRHDAHVLCEVVRRGKSLPSLAKRDDAIFTRAVAAAIRSARDFNSETGFVRP